MTLADKAVGDIVKIKENGKAVNYIIVHKGKPSSMYDASCDGIWLLRQQAHSNQVWAANNKNDYENSSIRAWLDSTFLNTVDEKIREAIKTVKIPYKKGLGNASTPVQSGSSGLSCRIFLLSGYEVGFTQTDNTNLPIDGAKLGYFSDNNSRICKDSSNSTVAWWLRSPNTSRSNYPFIVNAEGLSHGSNNSDGNWAARPAFILPTDLSVDSDGNVSTNIIPTITSSTASGSNLGEVSKPINLTYSVNDEDGDTVTVREYLDDVLTRTCTAVLGAENTFGAVNDPIQFQKILNGQHTLKVVANDGKDDSEPYTVIFNKQVRTATITLNEPFPADDIIKAAVLSVSGNIPYDTKLKVLVTNNALDDEPVWEDMTNEVKKGVNHVFTNQTTVNGFAFNFKVTATRGESDEQGFISNIGGAFE